MRKRRRRSKREVNSLSRVVARKNSTIKGLGKVRKKRKLGGRGRREEREREREVSDCKERRRSVVLIEIPVIKNSSLENQVTPGSTFSSPLPPLSKLLYPIFFFATFLLRFK